jgi:hypothetical protein
MSADDDEAKGIAELAMAMPDAMSAIAVFVNNAPELPHDVETEQHRAFLAGKDAVIGVTLAAFRADHRSGPLKDLSADHMLGDRQHPARRRP